MVLVKLFIFPLIAMALGSLGTTAVSPPPRLVILYATCTLNKNYLSPYNRNISFTPHLEKFAQAGVVFTKHHTEAGQSGIAYASIFSGAQADKHRGYRHPIELSEDLFLISEAHAKNGYETFFWNAHGMASPALNYAQGVPPQNAFAKLLQAEDEQFVRILERLQSDKEYKAFIITNFTVTHGPYREHHLDVFREHYASEFQAVSAEDISRYAALYQENHNALSWNFPQAIQRLQLSQAQLGKLVQVVELLYKSNVAYLDTLFGALVQKIESAGLVDQSLIVFTADHGEVLYRENAPFKWSHSMQLAPEVVTVPLIIRSAAPRFQPGSYTGVSRSIDVFPTMAGLSGLTLSHPEQVDGVDLSPALFGSQNPPDLSAYSHTTVLVKSVFEQMQTNKELWGLVEQFFPNEDVNLIWTAVRRGDTIYKLRKNLHTGSWHIAAYDLRQDPGETRNVYNPNNPLHKRMAERLAEYKAHLVHSYTDLLEAGEEPLLPTVEEQKRLRSLGYIK